MHTDYISSRPFSHASKISAISLIVEVHIRKPFSFFCGRKSAVNVIPVRENPALFLPICLLSTLIGRESGASSQRDLKMPALRFSVDGRYFVIGAFSR